MATFSFCLLVLCTFNHALAGILYPPGQVNFSRSIGGFFQAAALSSKSLQCPLESAPNVSGYPVPPPPEPWQLVSCHPTESSNTSVEPYCHYLNPKFSPPRGLTVFTLPSLLPRLPQPTKMISDADRAEAPWNMISMPGKGLGGIARRRIERGELIAADHPVLMYAASDRASDALGFDQWAFLRGKGLQSLSADGKKVVLSMHAEGQPDLEDEEWVDSLLARNVFEATTEDEMYFALAPSTARFNHDCRPNSVYYFDPKTLTIRVYAGRTIYPNEEITISYNDGKLPYEERQNYLYEQYGFKCTCRLCNLSPERRKVADERARVIEEISSQIDLHESSGDSAGSVDVDMGQRLISLYEEDGLESQIYDAYILAALNANAFGRVAFARNYALLAIDSGIIGWGPDWNELPWMWQLYYTPEEHWSYGIRLQAEKEVHGDRE